MSESAFACLCPIRRQIEILSAQKIAHGAKLPRTTLRFRSGTPIGPRLWQQSGNRGSDDRLSDATHHLRAGQDDWDRGIKEGRPALLSTSTPADSDGDDANNDGMDGGNANAATDASAVGGADRPPNTPLPACGLKVGLGRNRRRGFSSGRKSGGGCIGSASAVLEPAATRAVAAKAPSRPSRKRRRSMRSSFQSRRTPHRP